MIYLLKKHIYKKYIRYFKSRFDGYKHTDGKALEERGKITKKRKNIIFVLTFASITDRVLPLIEKIRDKGEITIVVSTDQLEKFFKNNTEFNIIRTKVHPDLIDRKTKHKILFNIIRSKFEYRKLFSDIKNSNIYFTNKGCALVTFSYIKKLSKNNKVFFFESEAERDGLDLKIEKSFRATIMRWIAKWLMGVDTVIRNRSNVPLWSLDKKYFENIERIKIPPGNKEIIKKYASNLDILKGKKILIAYNDSISCDFVEEKEFTKRLDELFEILNEKAPGQYIIKPHPRLNKLYGKMANTKEIVPAYIPLQLVLGHDWEYAIGFDSESLISTVNFTDSEVFSLIDAVEYKDKNLKKMFRDNLEKKSNNKIKILNKIEDLKDAIKLERLNDSKK